MSPERLRDAPGQPCQTKAKKRTDKKLCLHFHRGSTASVDIFIFKGLRRPTTFRLMKFLLCPVNICFVDNVLEMTPPGLTPTWVPFTTPPHINQRKEREVVFSLIWKAFRSDGSGSLTPTAALLSTPSTTWAERVNQLSQGAFVNLIHKFCPFSLWSATSNNTFHEFPPDVVIASARVGRPQRPPNTRIMTHPV